MASARALTSEEIEELAALLYVHFQERIEDPDEQRLVAASAPYDSVNHYTQKAFRDGAVKVVRRSIEMFEGHPSARHAARRRPPRPPAAGDASPTDGS